jgi:ribosomal protein S14
MARFPTITTLNKKRNRCVISGRNRNVLTKTKTSRFVFRQLLNLTILPSMGRFSR